MFGQYLEPQVLLKTGCQTVTAGQHQIDVQPPSRLLRLQFARQFGGRCFDEADPRDILTPGVFVIFKRRLNQGQGTAHVHHIDGHRLLGQVRTRCVGRSGQTNNAGQCAAGQATQEIPTIEFTGKISH